MRLRPGAAPRGGMSILEVLLAMTIFLMALVGLSQLLTIATDLALETEYTNRAHQLCQSKINEFVAGVQPFSSQGESSFEEEPAWTWTAECEPDGSLTGLWTVTVRVSRKRMNETMFEASLTQMVFDPASKGAIEPPPAAAGSTTPTTPTGGN